MVTKTQIKKLKQQAKVQAAQSASISYQQALDALARDQGYAHFSALLKKGQTLGSNENPALAAKFDEVILSGTGDFADYKHLLEIESHGRFSAVYAPFDDINRSAKIAIVGVTPGNQQARNALMAYRSERVIGSPIDVALAKAKVFAAFSGPMRSNLVNMLDEIGVNKYLDITSTAEAFVGSSHLCHFTSLLRYPVFMDNANYSGTPLPSETPFLWSFTERYFAHELQALPDVLWVPLGNAVKEAFQRLIKEGKVHKNHVLMGLPHPSGANSERINYFLGRKGREALSAKTNPDQIEKAKRELLHQIRQSDSAISKQVPGPQEQQEKPSANKGAISAKSESRFAAPEDLYCRQFYLDHNSGDKLYAKRIKSQNSGRYAYVVSPGGNTRDLAVELETEKDLIHYVFELGYAVRTETLPTASVKRTGLYRASGRSVRRAVWL